jgi:hypothetical protein
MKRKIVFSGDGMRRVWGREILIAETILVEELYHLVYSNITPCSPLKLNDFSKKYFASISNNTLAY